MQILHYALGREDRVSQVEGFEVQQQIISDDKAMKQQQGITILVFSDKHTGDNIVDSIDHIEH
jgi:hypothetical protein